MLQTFLLTLQKVAMLLCFIGLGYLLRRREMLPKDAARVLSKLCASVFLPAYTVLNLSKNMNPATLLDDGLLVAAGCFWMIGSIPLAYLLRHLLGKTPAEKGALTYIFIFTNYGYFGYPVIEGVFGAEVLGKMLLFLMPYSIAINSYGYALFVEKTGGVRGILKKLLQTPVIWAVFAGIVLGLLQVKLEAVPVAGDVLRGAGACMSPCSMLLAGVVMGGYPLKKLFGGKKGYLILALRMLALPALGLGVCMLLRLKGYFLLFPMVLLCMPLGLNTVVFPESRGEDASENARMVFQSTLLTLVTLPLVFSLIRHLAGL